MEMEKINHKIKHMALRCRYSQYIEEKRILDNKTFFGWQINSAETLEEREKLIKLKNDSDQSSEKCAFAESEKERVLIELYAEINNMTQWDANDEVQNYIEQNKYWD